MLPSTQHPLKPTAPLAREEVPEARSYILVDAGTGNVLAGYREHLRVPPASLTKVITALIAVGYLARPATVAGTEVSENAYPNRVGMEKAVPWPLDEVLGSLLVYSANDAAYAIAQRIGGSLAGFVPIMKLAARQMGMADNPLLHDPAGLDGTEGFRGGNLVSARDLATAGRDLLAVPLLARIVQERSYDFVDPTGTPHYLPSMDYAFLSSYPGAIGIKTGFTDRAGDCLLAAARRHGRTMIAVVMDGYNPTQTATLLLNQGFATPARDEPTNDRLPPVLLPGPLFGLQRATAERAIAAEHSRAGGNAGGRAATVKGASGELAAPSRPAHALTGKRLAEDAPKRPPRSGRALSRPTGRAGLGPVLASWPAELLISLAAIMAFVAIWQAVGTNVRRRQRSSRQLVQHAPEAPS